jgi:hypothetical protein
MCFQVIQTAARPLEADKPLLLAAWAARPPKHMKTSSVSPRSATALVALLIAGAALVTAPQARADDGRVVLSTGLGAVAGALIGQSIGGRNATIVGGALGAAIGASAATQGGRDRDRGGPGYSGYYQGGYQGGYAPVAPVVYAPPVRVYRPVIYPVAYYGSYGGYRGHGGGYDSDDRRRDGRGWDHGRSYGHDHHGDDRRDDRRGGGYDRGRGG